MALNPDSNNFDTFTEWYQYFLRSDPLISEGGLVSQAMFELSPPSGLFDPLDFDELFPMEPNTQPISDDNGQQISIVHPTQVLPLSPSPPPPQPITFDPPKWQEIPQRRYKQKQWDFKPSRSTLFEVNSFPGMNLGEALRNRFTGLEGRDEPVLQGAKNAIACRFLFPGYPSNTAVQIFTTSWGKKPNRIIRSKLAFLVARKLKHYLDAMKSSQVMNPAVDRKWQIGEGFMHIDNMFLAKLVPVSKASYQAEIWVMDPTV